MFIGNNGYTRKVNSTHSTNDHLLGRVRKSVIRRSGFRAPIQIKLSTDSKGTIFLNHFERKMVRLVRRRNMIVDDGIRHLKVTSMQPSKYLARYRDGRVSPRTSIDEPHTKTENPDGKFINGNRSRGINVGFIRSRW